MPTHLGLDCGVLLAQTTPEGHARLLTAAWTGPRAGYVVQAADPPSQAPRAADVLFIVSEEPRGEFLDADRSRWVGQLEGGETLIVGHVDYNLGVVAKEGWQVAVDPLPNAEPTLHSERHAIAMLDAAGMHGSAVAQAAEFGSEEGTVMFVSHTGQISVVSVAPVGGFDPSVPRYLEGETTTLKTDGVTVRRTDVGTGQDNVQGAEFGWACGDWVWILDPPINCTADEMPAIIAALILVDDC